MATKLKTALDLAEPPPATTPLRSVVELTSADLLAEIEAKAQRLQAEAEASARAAEDFRRSVAGKHAECTSWMNRLARAILERKWLRAETALAVAPADENLLGDLLVRHHDERESYTLAAQRAGDPFAIEMPRSRPMEFPGGRAGERAWVLLVDLATRSFRSRAATARVALLDAEIAGLVKSILASRSENGFDLVVLGENAAALALPVNGERRAVTAAEILAEVEASR